MGTSLFKKIGPLLLVFTIYNGFLVALVKYMGINLPISPINIIVILSFPLLLLYFISPQKQYRKQKAFFQIILIFIVCKILYMMATQITLTDGMTFLLYSSSLLACFYFMTTSYDNVMKGIRYLKFSLYLVGAIFFIQYFFHQVLPEAFTDIPNLFLEAGVDRYTRDLVDVVIYRPNGLIGNPITLGYYLNIILSIELFSWNSKSSKTQFIKIATLCLMIFLLFSRANILLSLALLFFNIVLRKGFVKSAVVSLVIFVVFIVLLSVLYTRNPYVAFAVDRFTGSDSYAAASNMEHINDYLDALRVYVNNPIMGISPEQKLQQDLITDGALLIVLLYFGTVGFLLLSAGYYWVLKKVKSLFKANKNFAPQIIFLVLFIPYSILNSAVLDKGLLVITGIYIGIFLNLALNKKYVES